MSTVRNTLLAVVMALTIAGPALAQYIDFPPVPSDFLMAPEVGNALNLVANFAADFKCGRIPLAMKQAATVNAEAALRAWEAEQGYANNPQVAEYNRVMFAHAEHDADEWSAESCTVWGSAPGAREAGYARDRAWSLGLGSLRQ